MSILVKSDTKFLVQGITGGFGGRHAQLSLDYGSQLVAGGTPGNGSLSFDVVADGEIVYVLQASGNGNDGLPAGTVRIH